MSVAPDSIMGKAISAVTSQMSQLDGISKSYQSQLSNALKGIGQIKFEPVEKPVELTAPEFTAPETDVGEPPKFEPKAITVPQMPSALSLDALFKPLDLKGLDYPAPPPEVKLELPERVQVKELTPPEKPDIDTGIEFPEAPTLNLPELGELQAIEVPEFEFPELPEFDGEAPDPSKITVPEVFTTWSEPSYASEMLPELQAQIRAMMSVEEGTATGLPAAVEDALFSRARDRDRRETDRDVQQAVDTWAGRGFSMPPGMLVKQANVAREEGRVRASELNRDIMIESAKWKIESVRFAVEQGLALEQLTMNLHENMAKRMFEAAKYRAEAEINIFDSKINLFNAQNSAFDTLAKVYKTKLDGALAKLDAYKTQVDAQAAIGQVNQQTVDVYRAELDAVQSSVEIYKAMMGSAKVKADVMKSQFDAYRSEIQGFAEEVGAEKAKVEAYEAQVKGETAKTGALEAQARAYASTVQAVSSRADVQIKTGQLNIENARAQISQYLADIDAFKAELQSSLSEAQFEASAYAAEVEGWKAASSAEIASAEVQSRFADTASRTNIAYAEMRASQYQANIQQAVEQARIASDAAKAVGQYTAQLAAGAMSAAHVSASISGSGSGTSTDSRTRSTTTSHNYNY